MPGASAAADRPPVPASRRAPCGGDQRFSGIAGCGGRRDAGARDDGERYPTELNGRCHRFADPPRDSVSFVGTAKIRAEDRELAVAYQGRGIGGADHAEDPLADHMEDLVTGGLTDRAASARDHLKADHHHGYCRAGPFAAP